MGLKMLTNPRVMEMRISQIGDRAMRGMARRMRLAAIEIRDLARDNAPVKTGLLESAIDYTMIREGRREAFVVFIDLDATKETGQNGRQVEVGDYAYLMEEQLRPYGRGDKYALGPLSRRKRAGGKKVGGRFLGRAISDVTKSLMAELAGEVQRATSFNGASSTGVRYQREYNGDDE